MTLKSKSLASLLACSLLLALPMVYAQGAPQQSANPAEHGIAVGHMDKTVKPGDDFYRYANGTWLKTTEIPPDRAAVGVFSILDDIANKRTAALIEEVAKSNPKPGSGQRKIADLFNTFIDEAAIEAKGTAPLKAQLAAIAAIKDKKQLSRALGESIRADVDALNNTNFHTANIFGLWVAPGFEDSDHYNAYLMQGGIQLPDREYYLSDSPHMKDLRAKYQPHVSAMLKLAGLTDTDARAARIVELEHAIAEKHLTLDQDQDVKKANNPWKQADFAAKAPGLDWAEFFRGAGLTKQQTFIVWQPTAFTGESALVASAPLDSWKDLLAYHLIEAQAGMLPKALVDERFNFFGKELSGTSQLRPRWQRGVFLVNGFVGDEVGKLYAQKYFPPEAKAQVQDMVTREIAEFHKRVDALAWMDPSTKAEAHKKLDTLYVGIGYPETWHDYSNYAVKTGDAYGNLWRGNLAYYQRQIARLGGPVDKHEWSMTPQTVNAVNLPLQNALNFPAAILQPGFFDPQAPAAANYGAIGSIIGHEISHTFDSEGSAFDSKGALRDWWKPADFEHFKAASKVLIDQYNAYKPFPDLSLNGAQTVNENTADVAGLADAYDAYHSFLAGKTAPEQDGLTGDQQFFIANAQAHVSKTRDAALRSQVLGDEHSPGEWRAATVRNIDQWYPAFDVKPGDKMYLPPDKRVKIW
jgi:Predicted metalloendopeptidase